MCKQTTTLIISTHFLLQIFDVVGLSVLGIINKSLLTGVVPKYLKHATVKPLLKKPNLDPTILSN